ncbi:hypothetical protein OPV22_019282 [Ensete ventricosum]|uniref:Uncharacterized protein n=1 Tax=Ensete ventricosum TaxID=4639 RepID=A0AAV8QKK6_ENSVE|nr:hypothetical protein OPV22_019282 [Ensete ventricosum]
MRAEMRESWGIQQALGDALNGQKRKEDEESGIYNVGGGGVASCPARMESMGEGRSEWRTREGRLFKGRGCVMQRVEGKKTVHWLSDPLVRCQLMPCKL